MMFWLGSAIRRNIAVRSGVQCGGSLYFALLGGSFAFLRAISFLASVVIFAISPFESRKQKTLSSMKHLNANAQALGNFSGESLVSSWCRFLTLALLILH